MVSWESLSLWVENQNHSLNCNYLVYCYNSIRWGVAAFQIVMYVLSVMGYDRSAAFFMPFWLL